MGIGIPTDEKLTRVNEKLGAISKPRWQTFKLLRAGSALARRKPWAAPLAVPGDALWRLAWAGAALAGPRLGRDESITPEIGFGADYAAFWDRARQNYGFIQVRDVAFMTWRYVEMPLQSYEIPFLRKAGHVKGYVVLGTHIDPDKRTGQSPTSWRWTTTSAASPCCSPPPATASRGSAPRSRRSASARTSRCGRPRGAPVSCEASRRAPHRSIMWIRDVQPAEGGYRPPLPDTGRSGRRLLGRNPIGPAMPAPIGADYLTRCSSGFRDRFRSEPR